MSALKPVGVNITAATSTASAQTAAIPQKTDSIRVLAETSGVYVAIGTNPTATNSNFYVSSTESEVISIGPVGSQRVVGVTTGTSTIIDFPEGTGSPFGVGDAVSLTVVNASTYDFSHKIVSSVDSTPGISGYYNTRITVDHDSSSVTAGFNDAGATLRRSLKVAVKTETGTGKVFIQQVQVS
tara:strand:+ start:47833 stop:48381 length:549 start_codon:yes stop_codon:yes gene_type:complete